MRKLVPIPSKLEIGKIRTKRKFLFLPRLFDGDWRWLEFADIVETTARFQSECSSGVSWQEIDFLDNRTRALNNYKFSKNGEIEWTSQWTSKIHRDGDKK